MNYITEIKSFNEWLETNELSTSGITLWYALMYIANRSGWKPQLYIPVSVIMLRTKMSRSSIYRERDSLRNFGLIDFKTGDGRQSSIYKIFSFESGLVSQTETQTDTQNPPPEGSSDFASHTGTQNVTQTTDESHAMSHTETQLGTEEDFVSHAGTQDGTIYKHKHLSIDNKEIDKRGAGKKRKPTRPPSPKKEDFNLSFIGDPAWETLVRTWLEYKRSRNEGYKSDLSVKKFHTMLSNLSRGDCEMAGKIIDKSIANNWAGIFELTGRSGDTGIAGNSTRTEKTASGQRIGQIKQPEDEERRQKLLAKFDKKK